MMMSFGMALPLPLIFLIFGIPDVFSEGDWAVHYSASHICALKNSSVIMSCTYKYPAGHQIITVLWNKDLVKHGEELADLSDDPEYSQRFQYLGDKQQNCTIRLSHVTKNDEHQYYFRFITDKIEGRWLGKPGVRLSVTDLQLKSPERVTEGDSVRLTCKSSCNLTDTPTFIWYRNSQRLTEGTIGDKLILNPVRREDAGRYRCAVHGHTLTSPEVYLDVTYPPKETLIVIDRSAVIMERDSVSLSCSSDSNPPAEISWFKGTQYIRSGRTFTISNISSDDSGEYKCKSLYGNVDKYSDPVTLDVQYPPRNISVSISGSAVIMSGDSVTLSCSSDSNPPAQINWFKGETSVGFGRIFSISKISSDDSGEYKCRATNEHGGKHSDLVTLDVQYSPRSTSVSINGSAVIMSGDSVSLMCISDSNPPALIFSWFKENQSSAVGSGQSFSAVQSGRFYCEAHNPHGAQRSDAVTVTVRGRMFAYAAAGVIGGLAGLLLIFIIVFMKNKHRSDGNTQKQDDLYVNLSGQVSAQGGLQPKSDPANQSEGLYSLVTLSRFNKGHAEGKTSDSEDEDEIQYVTVRHHRNENESQYVNFKTQLSDSKVRSADQSVEDQSVIYSTIK